MNVTALTKALKFACLPTLSLLALLFFGFFSITKTIEFIASDNGWAILLRIVAFLAEVFLVLYFYDKYKTEEILEGNINIFNKTKYNSTKELYKLKDSWSSSDNYYVYDTNDSNVVCIKRVDKNNY